MSSQADIVPIPREPPAREARIVTVGVYLGWTGFFTIFCLGAMLWLEALLSATRRPLALDDEPDLAVFSVVWTMLGLVEIAAFVLLYVVQ